MHLAAAHLVNVAPQGVKSLVDFWAAIGKGAEWHHGFQTAFGMSVEQCHAAFDAFRASL